MAVILFIPVTLIILCVFGALVYLFALLVKALRKYIRSGDVVRKENAAVRKSLGEVLKECRLGCGMTQELVAERLEVSRQAVSKWENGTSDPSTTNLLALSKLYGVSPEELLNKVRAEP